LDGISESTFNEIVGEVPSKEVTKTQLDGAGLPVIRITCPFRPLPEQRAGAKGPRSGGIYVNNVREANLQRAVSNKRFTLRQHLLLRKGNATTWS